MHSPAVAQSYENTNATASDREQALVHWLRDAGSVAIGFSGGVDSTYLACVALDTLGPPNVLAVVGRSASYPAVQWERARSVAAQFGVPVLEVDTDELHDPRYAANPSNRCYFCKSELWSRVLPVARAQGKRFVIDGTNADDLHGHRPGAAAAREQGVRSPLAELGFTKADIRALSRRRDIPTWSQPASPCLSSRIPYGTAVTVERLRRIEIAEEAARALGVAGDLRVRDHDDLARVELHADELRHWLHDEHAVRLGRAIQSAGFARVALDVRGFASGSLNARASGSQSVPHVRSALATHGITADAEAHGSLLLLDARARRHMATDPASRERLMAAAAAEGFTHTAVEITAPTPER